MSKTLTRADLSNAVYREIGLSLSESNELVDSVIEEIIGALENKEDVKLSSFGTFKLKSFFSEGMETQSGEEVSTREIKKILLNLVEKENKRKPLTDEKLANFLKDKGYNIARRTIAKYREQLNIPVARLRKEL